MVLAAEAEEQITVACGAEGLAPQLIVVPLMDKLEAASALIEIEPGEIAPFDGEVQGIYRKAFKRGGCIGVGDLQRFGLTDAIFDQMQTGVAVDGLIPIEGADELIFLFTLPIGPIGEIVTLFLLFPHLFPVK